MSEAARRARAALAERRLLAAATRQQRDGEGWAQALARSHGWLRCGRHGIVPVENVEDGRITLRCGCSRPTHRRRPEFNPPL